MKKSRVIEIFRFLNGIKLNKVLDKDIRSMIISNHMQMYNITKQYDEDVKELQRKLFLDKQTEIEELSKLREDYKNSDNISIKKEIESKIIKDYSNIISLEIEFNNELNNILNTEIDINLKKVSKENFVEMCVNADIEITANDLLILIDLFE